MNINGKKFLQLTNNILLEYSYAEDCFTDNVNTDNNIQNYCISEIESNLQYSNTYGSKSLGYNIIKNNTNNEVLFFNDILTNNTIDNAVLPIENDLTQWIYVNNNTDYFKTIEIDEVDTNEYIPYDSIKIYFQSGYVTDYDGFILTITTKDKKNKIINLLSTVILRKNSINMIEPMWFNDKIYTTYIEYRIPSTSYLTSDCLNGSTTTMLLNNWCNDYNVYDKTSPIKNTLPFYLTNGNGFNSNPPIGIKLFGISGYSTIYKENENNINVFKTINIVSTIIPNKDTYDKLFAKIQESNKGDFFECYGYYKQSENNEIPLFDYLSNFDTTFTIVHIIEVVECYINDNNETKIDIQPPISFIQTWENLSTLNNGESPIIKFRPIIQNNNIVEANINYTIRIVSNKDSTSIIKSSTTQLNNPNKYGLFLNNVKLNNLQNINIYNRIEKTPELNINEVVYPIKGVSNNKSNVQVIKYVTSSFIDRRNIRVSISPANIELK